jgi:hypothetical protein
MASWSAISLWHKNEIVVYQHRYSQFPTDTVEDLLEMWICSFSLWEQFQKHSCISLQKQCPVFSPPAVEVVSVLNLKNHSDALRLQKIFYMCIDQASTRYQSNEGMNFYATWHVLISLLLYESVALECFICSVIDTTSNKPVYFSNVLYELLFLSCYKKYISFIIII